MEFTERSLRQEGRIDVADVLRGLAVLGIILLHSIEHFNFGSYPDTSGQSAWLTFADRAVWDGLFFLLGGKAYAVFALLFGFSFFIQESRRRERGEDFRLRFCWRLVLLFIIGNFNGMFFTAEILVLYSLVGFILPLTCRLRTRTLLWIAGFLLLQPICIWFVARAAADPSYVTPAIPSGQWWGACFNEQYAGSFLSTARANLLYGQIASLAWAWDHGRVCQTAALFILGMLIGRHSWFSADRLSQWGKVLLWAVPAFFVLHGLDQMVPDFIGNRNILSPLSIIISSLANFSLMLILVAGVLFAWYCTRARIRLALIIPYGRMSLTNYVTQSIVGSLLYYNWGFGLHVHLTIFASVLLGVLLFLLQYAACRWWLARFTHGPLEYAWKCATFLRAFPFRRKLHTTHKTALQ